MSDVVDTATEIARGREAWAKIGTATSFASWKAICLALAIGREQAFRKSGANAPHGTRYSRCFNEWLKANDFGNMPFGIRAACLRLADHLGDIEQWRAGLPGDARQAQNHPQVILRNWRKATGRGTAPKAWPKANGKRAYAGNRPICFDQEAVRRAGLAMKESRSSDWFKLAGVALHAAIRDRGDLLALLAACAPPTASKVAVYVAPQQAAFPTINMPVAIR
jgi:hypothetical protein